MISSSLSRFVHAAAFVGLSTLVAGTACVQDQDFVIIEAAIWFDDSCTLSENSNLVASMDVDVSFDTEIAMAFVFTNHGTPNPASNTGIDDSEVYIESAQVNLSFSGGSLAASSFEITLPHNSVPGQESIPVLVKVPSEVADSLRGTMAGLPAGTRETLEMEVVIRARKANQVGNSKLGSFETRPFVFPFDICYGCLASCVPASDCGGDPEDPPVCASPTGNWVGFCGYAQGIPIVDASCG